MSTLAWYKLMLSPKTKPDNGAGRKVKGDHYPESLTRSSVSLSMPLRGRRMIAA